MKDLEKEFPGMVHSSRGLGTFCAIDADTGPRRDAILTKLRFEKEMLPKKLIFSNIIFILFFLATFRDEGVNTGGCGASTIRLRPALIFGPEHSNIFIEKMRGVLKTL